MSLAELVDQFGQLLVNPSSANRESIVALLKECGYKERRATDYRGVMLMERDDWPRHTFRYDEHRISETQLKYICKTTIQQLNTQGKP